MHGIEVFFCFSVIKDTMKLEAQFENKSGKLFSIKTGREIRTDNLVRVDAASIDAEALSSIEFAAEFTGCRSALLGLCLAWKTVEITPEVYNEEFLAALRDFLKNIEASDVYAVILPETDGTACGAALEQYTAAMVHAARRIKDCESVIGFSLPPELAADGEAASSFMNAMAVKHAQYVYFSANDTGNTQLVPYHMR
ncbi:MAG TPA: hypothetical protein DCL73_02395 [Treponema sp.]|nr:hypothetical protein [Treponema sp.]